MDTIAVILLISFSNLTEFEKHTKLTAQEFIESLSQNEPFLKLLLPSSSRNKKFVTSKT